MNYTIDEIIKRLSEPEKLISPEEINILQAYLNGHITSLEEEAWGRQLVASNKLAELIKPHDELIADNIGIGSGNAQMVKRTEMSAAKAEIIWKVSNEFRLWQGLERTIKKLKRYRSDLKDRFLVLTQTKRY